MKVSTALQKGILRQIRWCKMLSLSTQWQPWRKIFLLCTKARLA